MRKRCENGLATKATIMLAPEKRKGDEANIQLTSLISVKENLSSV